MASILKQISELNRSGLRSELKELVSKLRYEQVEALVPKCFTTTGGTELLQTILYNFEDSPSCHGKLFKAIEICMKQTGCGNAPTHLILMFVSKCSSDELVKLIDQCVDLIRTAGSGSNNIWKDALPQCLSILSSHSGCVNHCGTEMPISEFKSKCLTSICHMNWPDEINAQMASMFVDITLTKDEHAIITNKICSQIALVKPESLPPLFHQLLRLCKNRNVNVPFKYFDDYFKTRLYSKVKLLENNLPDSESTNFETDDIDINSIEELQQALSTCLYHISQGSLSQEMKRALVKEWNKTSTLSSPFLCNVLLAVANQGYDSASYLGILKSCVYQQCMFRHISVRSAWWRSMSWEVVNTKLLFITLLDETKNHGGQLTSKALLDLGFALLSVRNREPGAELMWAHGQTIIAKLCRCHPGSLPTILSMLVSKLVSDNTNSKKQFSDTLAILSQHVPHTMCENSSAVQSLLEQCFLTNHDWAMSCYITDAVQLIAKLNTRVRDSILMLCRKGTFARDDETRRAAVSGLLGLLRRLRASQTRSGSSNSVHSINSSSHSFLTQISIELRTTGEGIRSIVNDSAISEEIITILKRCLIQSGVVKEDFYKGLCSAVINKPFLKGDVLDLLLDHLDNYLVSEESDSPFCPLIIEKCIVIKDTGVILVEPLAHLINVFQQLLLYPSSPDNEPNTVDTSADASGPNLRTSNYLSRISDAMASCHVENYGLDNSIGLQDLLPESKAKAATVQQIVLCLEALMAYRINEWNIEHEEHGNKILNLFKAFQEIADFTKTSTKGKKVQKTSPKGKKKKGEGMKLNSLVKDKAAQFRLPLCLWDIRTSLRILSLLQCDTIPWAKLDTTTCLRTKREFQRFAIKAVCDSLTVFKNDHLPSKQDLKMVAEIAKLIYEQCLLRFENSCAFDQQTCLHLLECFEKTMSISLEGKIGFCEDTFAKIVDFNTDSNVARTSDVILTSLAKCLEQTKDNDTSSIDDEEPSAKKIVVTIIKCITLLVEMAPNHFFKKACHMNTHEENFGEEALIILENYFRESPSATETILVPLLMLIGRRRQDWSLVDSVATKIGKIVGIVTDEDENVEESHPTDGIFPSLTDRTAGAYLTVLCLHLSSRCESAQRALTAIAEMTQSQRVYKDAFRSLFVELCRLSTSLTLCCAPQVAVGRSSNAVFKFACDHYGLLANLLKYLTARVSIVGVESGNHLLQYCRFEKLLKISGKKMLRVVDAFILYVSSADGGTTKSKVLKDTRIIPKLVFKMESFTRYLIILEKKCKQNFHVPLGTARDFRIQALIVKEALNAGTALNDGSEDNIQDVTENDNNEAHENGAESSEEKGNSSDRDKDDSDINSILNSESEDEESTPIAKKARLT